MIEAVSVISMELCQVKPLPKVRELLLHMKQAGIKVSLALLHGEGHEVLDMAKSNLWR